MKFALSLALVSLATASTLQADIANASFESVSELQSWTRTNNGTTEASGNTEGLTPTDGSFQAVITNNGGGTVSNSTLNTFFDVDNTAIESSLSDYSGLGSFAGKGGSGIKQTVSLEAGEAIQFDYALAYTGALSGHEEAAFFVLHEIGSTATSVIQLGTTFRDASSSTIPYTTFTSAAVSSAGDYLVGFGTFEFNEGGNGFERYLNLTVDNLAIVPEPSNSALLVALLSIGVLATRRRR